MANSLRGRSRRATARLRRTRARLAGTTFGMSEFVNRRTLAPMQNLNELVAQAERHVEAGRKIIARHRKRISDGTSAPGAAELLRLFEQTQAIFEEDLARLIRERAGK